jgi:hypothetical protein
MMETKGSLIEDVRDYVKRNRQGDMALCYLLDRFWPVPGDNSADMSGMICFVALFRVILCRLDPRDMMDDMIGQNGFLRFAVSSFGAAEGSAKERQACKLMHDLLAEELGGQPTFEHLAESDMLLKSIWSHDAFRLFYPTLWRSGPASSEWDCLPDESRDIVEAKKSLIVWDTSKHGSILDAAVNSEGVFRGRLEGVKEDHVEFVLAFRAPLVMRVKVLFDDKIEGFQMSDISSIRLPETRTALKQLGVGKGSATAPQVRSFTKGPGAYTYRLLAMVKLRATGSEQDDVRFYDPWGSLVLPQAGRPGLETFCSLDWSMQDQTHSLMLYYMRLETESSGVYTEITDEYGGEKSGAMSADTPDPGM